MKIIIIPLRKNPKLFYEDISMSDFAFQMLDNGKLKVLKDRFNIYGKENIILFEDVQRCINEEYVETMRAIQAMELIGISIS